MCEKKLAMKTRAADAWKAGAPLTVEAMEFAGKKADQVLIEIRVKSGTRAVTRFSVRPLKEKLSVLIGLPMRLLIYGLQQQAECLSWNVIRHCMSGVQMGNGSLASVLYCAWRDRRDT